MGGRVGRVEGLVAKQLEYTAWQPEVVVVVP